MIKNVNFNEMAAFLFGEEQANKIKEEATEKAEKAIKE